MVAITIGIVIALIGNLKQINHAFTSSTKHELSPISESKIFQENNDFSILSKLPISVLKPHGPIFFGSVEHILKAYSDADKHHTLIIDMRTVKMVDLTGIYALEDLTTTLQGKNIEVYITMIDSKIENLFKGTGFIETIGRDYISNDLKVVFDAIHSRKV
jgi:MFS superfamily sulfate permease-like transporter